MRLSPGPTVLAALAAPVLVLATALPASAAPLETEPRGPIETEPRAPIETEPR